MSHKLRTLLLAIFRNDSVESIRALVQASPELLREFVRDDTLPLHVAVSTVVPCLPVVELLLTAYPEAVRTKTLKDGYLPIHLAVVRAPVSIVELLLEKCPESMKAASNNGKIPLQCVLGTESAHKLPVVRHLLRTWPDATKHSAEGGYLPLHVAAIHNESLDVLEAVLQSNPAALRVATDAPHGHLPIHFAA